MSEESILTRSDWEDYLVRLYFGAGDDYLMGCIERAYHDFNRTLRLLRHVESKDQLDAQTRSHLRQSLNDIRTGRVRPITEDRFDSWHRALCQDLSKLYAQHGYEWFYVGQAQKWVNMSFKYIYAMGEHRLPGFAAVYGVCHVPLDNVLIARLAEHGFPRFPSPWSQIDDYDKYLAYQHSIRRRLALAPLDAEFLLWLGKGVDRWIREPRT